MPTGARGEMNKHAIVGGIAADNTASIALHLRFGFVENGRMPQVGLKFGRWLDLVLMQKLLDRIRERRVHPWFMSDARCFP